MIWYVYRFSKVICILDVPIPINRHYTVCHSKKIFSRNYDESDKIERCLLDFILDYSAPINKLFGT